MGRIFDRVLRKEIDVSPQEERDLFAQDPDRFTPVGERNVDLGGATASVDARDLLSGRIDARQLSGQEEANLAQEAELEAEFGGLRARSLVEAGLRGLTIGLSDLGGSEGDKFQAAQRQLRGTGTGLAEVGGAVLGAWATGGAGLGRGAMVGRGLLSRAAASTPAGLAARAGVSTAERVLGKKVAQEGVLRSVLRGAVEAGPEAALFGVGQQISAAQLHNEPVTAESLASHVGLSTLFGVGGGAVFGGAVGGVLGRRAAQEAVEEYGMRGVGQMLKSADDAHVAQMTDVPVEDLAERLMASDPKFAKIQAAEEARILASIQREAAGVDKAFGKAQDQARRILAREKTVVDVDLPEAAAGEGATRVLDPDDAFLERFESRLAKQRNAAGAAARKEFKTALREEREFLAEFERAEKAARRKFEQAEKAFAQYQETAPKLRDALDELVEKNRQKRAQLKRVKPDSKEEAKLRAQIKNNEQHISNARELLTQDPPATYGSVEELLDPEALSRAARIRAGKSVRESVDARARELMREFEGQLDPEELARYKQLKEAPAVAPAADDLTQIDLVAVDAPTAAVQVPQSAPNARLAETMELPPVAQPSAAPRTRVSEDTLIDTAPAGQVARPDIDTVVAPAVDSFAARRASAVAEAQAKARQAALDEVFDIHAGREQSWNSLRSLLGDDMDLNQLALLDKRQLQKALVDIDTFAKNTQRLEDLLGTSGARASLSLDSLLASVRSEAGDAAADLLGSMDPGKVAMAMGGKLDADFVAALHPSAQLTLRAVAAQRVMNASTPEGAAYGSRLSQLAKYMVGIGVTSAAASVSSELAMGAGAGFAGAFMARRMGGMGAQRVLQMSLMKKATSKRIQREAGKAVAELSFSPGANARRATTLSANAILTQYTFGRKKRGDDPGTARVEELLELSKNPQAVQQAVDAATVPIRVHNPALADTVKASVLARLNYIMQAMPRTAESAPLRMHNGRSKPSRYEMAKWARVVRAAEEPVSVLEDLRDGSVTPEAVRAVEELYPNLMHEMRVEVAQRLAEDTPKLSYQARLRLGIFMGAAVDASATPEFFLRMAELSRPAQPQQQASMRAAGSLRVPPAGDGLNTDTMRLTAQ